MFRAVESRNGKGGRSRRSRSIWSQGVMTKNFWRENASSLQVQVSMVEGGTEVLSRCWADGQEAGGPSGYKVRETTKLETVKLGLDKYPCCLD